MAEPGLTEIATTTLRRRSGKIADNVANNNPILFRMKKAGNIKMNEHGRTLVEEHDYAENANFLRYEGGEALNTSRSPVLTAFEYNYKQASVCVLMNGLEEIQNAGPEQVIKLFASRVENAERTIRNMIESDIRSDGTASGGKQIGGLDLLLAENPTTGTVGGVNRATNLYARNQKFAAIADGGAAASISNIERYMRQLNTITYRAGDTNKLWILGNTYWNLINEVGTGRQRYVDKEMADLGFDNIKVDGVTCILGGGYQLSGTGATAFETTKGYLVNLDYLKLRIGGDRFFTPLKDRESQNQDQTARFLVFAGNLTCSNFGLQGVLFDS